MKTDSWRPFGDTFCSFVWGGTRLGTPPHKYWGFGDPNIQTYKHTYLLNNWSIQTFDLLKSNCFLDVYPYFVDKTHANHTYKKIHTFQNGTFFSYILFDFLGIYRRIWEIVSKNVTFESLRLKVCMEECSKYASNRGLTYKNLFDVTIQKHPQIWKVC